MVYIFTQALSILTVAVNVFIILVLLLFFSQLLTKKELTLNKKLRHLFNKNYFIFALLISLVATLSSLYYSEVLQYTPCKLCWYQRVLMYPQVVLFGLSLWKKDKNIIPYTLILSIIGACIAGFHYSLQITNTGAFSCTTVGFSASCTENFFLTYGYITIPLMSLTAFLLLIFLGIYKIRETTKIQDDIQKLH